jgi:hypothetical protein
MKSEPDKLHLIRGGMRTTSDVELDDASQDVRRVLLDVAEELGPRPALAALESERVETAALILHLQRQQLDSDDQALWSRFEQYLHERQTFLDSLVPEIEWIDWIEVDEPLPPRSGLQLVWRNPAKVRSAADMEAA